MTALFNFRDTYKTNENISNIVWCAIDVVSDRIKERLLLSFYLELCDIYEIIMFFIIKKEIFMMK